MTLEVVLMIAALVLIAVALLITSFRKVPGIGVIIAVIIIIGMVLYQQKGLQGLGFFAPANWLLTILESIGFGILISVLSTILFEPLADKITKTKIDLSIFNKLKGDWKKTLLMIAVGWILAAFMEESIFRGFVFQKLAILYGGGEVAWLAAAILSSVLFGLAHWYQGKSGALVTGFVGLIFCGLFYFSGRNIWLPILTHGFVDTIGLAMMCLGWDTRIKTKMWGTV